MTYHAINNDLYGLTRIHYLGRDFTGRSGNFYARTLIFHPEDLQPVAFNPLLLARSGIFDQTPPEDQTILDPLETFPTCSSDPEWIKRVSQKDYTESYSALLSAIVHQEQVRKPVILLFKNLQESAAYLEALLMLLPPETRCRTTFTTYEPDPTLLLQRGGQDQMENLYLITTVAPESGGSFQVRPSELTQYLVWDFGNNIRSKFPERSIFSQEMLEFCNQTQPEKVKGLHTFLTNLGAGQSPETWDTLVKLYKSSPQLESSDLCITLSASLDALLIIAQRPGQFEASVHAVWPLLKGILQDQNDLTALTIEKFCQILQRLPDSTTTLSNIRQNLIPIIAQKVSEGNIQWAQYLAEKLAGESAQTFQVVTEHLAKEGWPNLVNIPDKAFRSTLDVLKSLANSTGFAEWVTEQLWLQTKQLAEKPQMGWERFAQVVKALIELTRTVSRGTKTASQIQGEVLGFIKMFLRRGYAAHARLLLELIDIDRKVIVTRVYQELIQDGWPKDLPRMESIHPTDQQALLEILLSAFEMIVAPANEKTEVELLLPAYQAAYLFGILNPYWQRTQEVLLKKLNDIGNLPNAFSFIEKIASLLQENKNNEDAYQLWYWYTQKTPPTLPADWSKRQMLLVKIAYVTRNSQANTVQALELMTNLSLADWLSVVQSIKQGLPRAATLAMDEMAIRKLTRIAETHFVSPTHPDLDGLMQIIQSAHSVYIADKLWLVLKGKGILGALRQSNDSRNEQWTRAVIDILTQYNLAQDVFDLLYSLASASPIKDLQDGKDRLNQLYPWAIRTGQKACLENLVRLIGAPLENKEQILLLASLLQQDGKASALSSIILERYQAILKSLPSSEQIWELRAALSQDEQVPAVFLVKDFLSDLLPWSKDGKTRLQAWHDRVLAKSPVVSTVLNQTLAQQLPGNLELSMEHFKSLGKDAPIQGRELFGALINSASMEKAVSLWQFVQQQKDWESTGLPRLGPRGKLLEWLERITSSVQAGNLNATSAFPLLEDWQKLRRTLDRDAEHWATEHLCILLSVPDLLKGEEWNTIISRSLQKYEKQGLQKASEYCTKETQEDPVKYFLLLLVMGQEGIKRIDDPNGIAFAEIVDQLLAPLSPPQRYLFWKRLEGMTAFSDSMFSHNLQRFRQFNSLTAKLGRWIGRIIRTKPSTPAQDSTKLEKTNEKKEGNNE